MAYTRTGRPVGRPKTKDYRTISLKIPQTLLDHVQQYARVHRQSMSELIREGLEWRIGEGDPLAQRYATGESAEQECYSNTEIPFETEGVSVSPNVLQQILDTLARQDTQLQALTQALEHRPVLSTPSEYSGNTTKVSTGQHNTPEPVREGNGRPASQVVHVDCSNTVLQKDEDTAARDTSTQQPDLPDKAALVARLHQMRANGLSLSQIAGQLQAEGLPTLSGKGQWQKGTVDKLLHSQAKPQPA
jgi:hypothetical protein